MDKQLHNEICQHLIESYEPRMVAALSIQYYAQRWTPSQIVRKLQKEHNLYVTRSAVATNCHRHAQYITNLKNTKDL